jgi:protein SCO1/2
VDRPLAVGANLMRVRNLRLRSIRCVLVLACALAASGGVRAHDAHGDHAAHAAAARADAVKQSSIDVSVPALQLLREDNVREDLRDAIGRGEPVFVNFIFTSCTTVCPVMSETFARLAEETARASTRPRLISISIDPEVDTPARLKAYAAQFGTPTGWHFYTGTRAESLAAQKAFGLEIADKMSHPVATFYHPGKGKQWIRIDGFAAPEDLAALVPQRTSHEHHHH